MPYCTSKITVDVSVTGVDIGGHCAILIVSTTKEIDMKFCVAYMDFFENQLTQKIVEADDFFDAVI